MHICSDNDTSVVDLSRAATYMSFYPEGASYKIGYHYRQLVLSGTFNRYDHGEQKNLELYGSESPPNYDLSVVDFPIALVGGLQDRMASPEDIKFIRKAVQKNIVYFSWQNLGHVGFMVAKDMSYMKEDLVAVLNYFNDKCSQATLNSTFRIGNARCRKKLAEK